MPDFYVIEDCARFESDGGGDDNCGNGRGKQGKDALSVCAQGLCKDAKPNKHTQTLTLRKIG